MIRRDNYIPVLSTLESIQVKYKSLYCYPAQKKILSLLAEHHDLVISISTLNRWLRRLEDQGYIYRERRIKRLETGTMSFQSTMYWLTQKAHAFIHRVIKKLAHVSTAVLKALSSIVTPDPFSELALPEGKQWPEPPPVFTDAIKALKKRPPKI